jgi:peptidyl-prolyl cis-trans isomerase SurA
MGQTGSTSVTIDELDKDIVKDLGVLKVGEISKPLVFTNERGIKGVRIVVIQNKTEPHRENIRDDYNKIAQRALDEKKTKAVEKWFKAKLPTYYVMIDPEYGQCASIQEMFPVANKTTTTGQ